LAGSKCLPVVKIFEFSTTGVLGAGKKEYKEEKIVGARIRAGFVLIPIYCNCFPQYIYDIIY
jgi:hypothetical protein